MKTTSTRRPAFTLVEMLVVILIMSILVTLVTLGVTRAMRFASEVGTKTEMAQIEQALGVAALDLGRVPYIPSYLKLCDTPSAYGASPTGLDAMSRRILQQMFPKWSDAAPAGWGNATLDASEAFVFILGGVEGNQGFSLGASPFSSPAASERRKGPYFNFDSKRLIPNVKNGKTYYRYLDYWNNNDTSKYPNPYLTAYSIQMAAKIAPVGDEPPSATNSFPVRQYQKTNVLYMPKGYQIFAAGKDGKWGTGYSTTGGAFNGLLIGDGEDDQCNFSESPLGKPIND